MALKKPSHTVPPSGLSAEKRSPTYAYQFDEIFDAVDDLQDGTLDFAQHITDTTDATAIGAPASFITDGGATIAKKLIVGNTLTALTDVAFGAAGEFTVDSSGNVATTGSVNANSTLVVGTSLTFKKGLNHTLSVDNTTVAGNPGGDLTVTAAAGNTTGAGGTLNIQGATGGATGNGGALNITSGSGGGTSGASGALAIATGSETSTDASGNITVFTGSTVSTGSGLMQIATGTVSTLGASGAITIASGASSTSGATGNLGLATGNATIGSSGTISITSGNTASGVAGDIQITTGTYTSTTVSPVISLNKAVIRKPASTSTASGGTITGPQLVGGLIAGTGATGNWQLPTAAQITTAIGATPAGTFFDFVFNAAAMTATNTATLVVGSNMTVMSAPPITGGGTLTVTQDTQVVGTFRIVFDTATTCKISRIS